MHSKLDGTQPQVSKLIGEGNYNTGKDLNKIPGSAGE